MNSMKKSPELLDNRIDNLTKSFDEHRSFMTEMLSSISNKLEGLPTLTQSVKTLHDWKKERVDPDLDTLMKWRWMILGGLSLTTAIGGGIVWLITQNMQLNLNEKIRASEDRQKEFIEKSLSAYEVPIE